MDKKDFVEQHLLPFVQAIFPNIVSMTYEKRINTDPKEYWEIVTVEMTHEIKDSPNRVARVDVTGDSNLAIAKDVLRRLDTL